MDLRQLRYFVSIVEMQSLTAAADALHISQPSLSQHVSNLEAEVGSPLLIRGRQGARPTELGQVLYLQAKKVLRQMDETRAALRRKKEVPSGKVRFGMPTSCSRLLALPLVKEIQAAYPDIILEIIEASSADLAEAVAQQRLDMAIAMDVDGRTDMQVVNLLEEHLMLVGRPIGGVRRSITLAEVAELPLLLPSFPNSIRVLADRAFAAAGLKKSLVAESSAVSFLLAAIRDGMGWSILPWSSLAGEHDDTLISLRISDVQLTRRASLCVSDSARLSLASTSVEASVLALVERMVQSAKWEGVELLRPSV